MKTEAQLVPLDQIEILADADGAPYAQVGNRLSLSLSISHSGTQSFCAAGPGDLGHMGADIEQIEPRDISFVRTFFTSAENGAVDASLASERDPLVNAIWSAKEAVLKTLRLGLRADTRQIEICLPPLTGEWARVGVSVDRALLPSISASLAVWCRIRHGYVLSLALLSLQ